MKFNALSTSNFALQPSRCKVLVLEDDPALVEVLEHLFTLSDFDFVIKNDASDIKALVYLHDPDVVLLDYLLPSTNGGNLCHQLKSSSDTSAIPVVIYSAVSKALLPIDEYHCDYFIEKPFDLDQLIKKLTLCCAKRRKKME